MRKGSFRGKVISALVLWLATTLHVHAQTLEIRDAAKAYKPSGAVAYLVDTTGLKTIAHVRNSTFTAYPYRTKTEFPLIKTGGKPTWCTFEVVNRTSERYFLEIKNPVIHAVDVFVLDKWGTVHQELHIGEDVAVNNRMVPHQFHYLPLDLPQDAVRSVYVRCSGSREELYIPMHIGTLNSFYTRDQRTNLSQGIFQGLVLFIVIYNLFLFITLRKYEYLYFTLFVACVGLLFAIGNGYGFEFFSGRWSSMYQYLGMVAALAGIFMILYSSYFLKSRFTAPKLHIWLLSIAGIYLLAIILNMNGKIFIALRFTEYNTAGAILFLLLVAFTVWKRGHKPAIYYLIGLSIFAVGFLLHLLRQLGALPGSFHDGPILQISSTLGIVTLSLAMGKKIDEYIDKRDEARALALKASMQNERLITHQNQILETKVLERTKDLEQTVNTLQKQREALTEANKFQDKVFSVISHDMKSPLSTLGGFLNVLKFNNISEQDKEKILDKVQLAVENTRNLLDNILVWATQPDQPEPDTGRYDIHAVVEEIFALFKLQAESKSIRLLNNTPTPFQVYGNRNIIQLVLRNLISNAIKFTEHQGKVWVMAEQTTTGVRIMVKDNGIGIKAENKEKILQDKYLLTTRGTDNEKGTGIGLRLCKEYIEKQGGHIDVESKEGAGTTFTIFVNKRLPPEQK